MGSPRAQVLLILTRAADILLYHEDDFFEGNVQGLTSLFLSERTHIDVRSNCLEEILQQRITENVQMRQ